MSPRPRKVSDEDVFAATYRTMTRLGPTELTLAEIAAEAGVTAGALVQRFGSKRALLLALARGAAASAGEMIRGLRAEHRTALATLRAYAACMAQLAASPAAVARNLAYLQIDVSDADFRKHLLVHARATREGIESLLDEAAEAGELADGTDTRTLARTVDTVLGGSLLSWAVFREGGAVTWLSADLEAVLAPYLASPPRARRRGR